MLRFKPNGRGSFRTTLVCAVALGLAFASGLAGASDPRLALQVAGGNRPVELGDIVIVSVVLRDMGAQQAAGFQAFLEFDEMKLLPISAQYSPHPFGLPVIDPITIGVSEIDMASGINQFAGQSPTSADSVLAVVQFVVLQDLGCVNSVFFRSHMPPTRVTDPVGDAISSLLLAGLGSGGSSDLTGDGVVGVPDLLLLLANWGPCPLNTPCLADLNCDGTVGVPDLLFLLSDWG